jgi:hypothetical protein
MISPTAKFLGSAEFKITRCCSHRGGYDLTSAVKIASAGHDGSDGGSECQQTSQGETADLGRNTHVHGSIELLNTDGGACVDEIPRAKDGVSLIGVSEGGRSRIRNSKKAVTAKSRWQSSTTAGTMLAIGEKSCQACCSD